MSGGGRVAYMMRCTRCGHAHDVGPVKVIQRYMDCTVWECPGCGSAIDDRPRAWGGSAVPVEEPVIDHMGEVRFGADL